MKYNQLGRSGVRVSALALGTATFGVAPLEKDGLKLIDRALELGINHIDVANSYGNQARFDRPGAPAAKDRASSEEIVGKAIKGRRNDIIISSKVMEPVGEGVNDRGLSRRHIFQQIERSLTRFGTDHIDIYYAHHPDVTTPIDETVAAFDDLVRQGKIRYYALSTYPAWRLTDALWKADKLGARPPVANQIPYNLALRTPEAEVIPAVLNAGMSLTVFSPLAGGLFAGAATDGRAFAGGQRWGGAAFNERQIDLAKKVEALAAETGISSPHLALAWLIAQPAVATAVIGPEDIAQLEANIGAADLDLDPVVLATLNEISKV